MQPENYYAHRVWTGTAYLQCNEQFGLENAIFLGEAWGTGDHALPIPAAYIPIEGRLKRERQGDKKAALKLLDEASDLLGGRP